MYRPLPLISAAFLALGGCAAQGDFPSLAMRPAERDLSFEEPERPKVEVASDPALLARLSALRAQAEAGERAFASALAAAGPVVARAGAARSDSWVEAQLALSRVEAARAPTATALAELDALRLARAQQATADADFAAVERAVAEVGALADSQHQRWTRLREQVSAG